MVEAKKKKLNENDFLLNFDGQKSHRKPFYGNCRIEMPLGR